MKARLLIGVALAAATAADPAATAATTFFRTHTFKKGDTALKAAPLLLDHNIQHVTDPGVFWVIAVTNPPPEQPYWIVFGPDPRGDPSNRRGSARIRNSYADPTGQHQELFVEDGFAYFFGTYPYGGTQGGSGVGHGTIFLVWARPANQTDYFVYLDPDGGPRMTVTTPPNPPASLDITQVNHYVEISDTGAFATPSPVLVPRTTLKPLRDIIWEMMKFTDLDPAYLRRPIPIAN